MTTGELNRISVGTVPEQARGWMASVLLHLLGLAGAMLIMAKIEQSVLLEPFHWDISMVDAPVRTEPTQSESMPAERVIQPPPSPVKPKPPVRTATQPIAQQTPLPTHDESTVPVETTQIVKDVVTNAEPVMESPVVESVESRPVTSQAVMAEPVASSEATTIEQRIESTETAVEQRVVQQRLVHYRRTQADYGWLGDMVRKRIEELKHYPRIARENHWEGRVVVQAVIKADGTVGELSVAESSGHALLDEEALAVMRKASPLTLKHQLEKSQITILVPISYRLEG
ncbi:MAG TPA: energy transducer TonB [Nitrospira sp.]|nr:energy transducer TonB [Nitrospira sp.]